MNRIKRFFTVTLLEVYPVIAGIMFDLSTFGQDIKMFREQSSATQEPISWLMVSIGLFGWYIYYKIKTPELRLARGTALFSSVVNFVTFLICIYYRF